MRSIANVKRRTLPAARRNVANVNGLKSEKFLKPVSVTSKPNTSRVNTSKANTDPEPEGCRHILPRVISQGRPRHIRQEGSFQDKDPFPLTRVEGLFPASDRFLLTTGAASSQVSDRFLLTTGVASSQANDLSLHTSLAEHYLVSGPFRLITAVEPCRALNRFLLTTPGVYCLVLNPFLPITLGVPYRTPPNLSPLTTAAEISHRPLLPRTTPTLTTGLPTMKLRRK